MTISSRALPSLMGAIVLATLVCGCVTPAAQALRDARHDDDVARLEQRLHQLEDNLALDQQVMRVEEEREAEGSQSTEALAKVIETLLTRNTTLETEVSSLRSAQSQSASNATTPAPSSSGAVRSTVGTASSTSTSTLPPSNGLASDTVLRALIDQLRSTPPGQEVKLSVEQQRALVRVLGPIFADEARRARFKSLDGGPVPSAGLRQIRNQL